MTAKTMRQGLNRKSVHARQLVVGIEGHKILKRVICLLASFVLGVATRLATESKISCRENSRVHPPPFIGDRGLSTQEITQDRIFTSSVFLPAAHSGCWNGVAQLPMLFHVAASPGGHKVPKRVVTPTCALGGRKSVSLVILTRPCEGLSTDGYHDRP